jgi:hypothetical protein
MEHQISDIPQSNRVDSGERFIEKDILWVAGKRSCDLQASALTTGKRDRWTFSHVIDRAYIIHDGALLMEGNPDEIIRDADVRRLYLGERFRL